jgi:flavin-dependent dehydrogenase
VSRVYDAIVVGARCAGASTAMLLARAGLDVLLVDRARFPSEIPHGHFIHRHGPQRLADWGLLERVLATGCPPATSLTTHFGDFPLVGTELVVDGVPVGLGPRRAALDGVLVEAAVEAGAELREGFAVEDLVWDGDRVTGVRSTNGVTERAGCVIGADGRNSAVAKRVQAPAYEDAPTVTCWYFSYWSGVSGTGLELYLRERRVIFAFPTNDGLFAVFVAWPIEQLDAVRMDTERQLLTAFDGFPDFAERMRLGTREERILGATRLPNFVRRPYGPGWALVGDAGCHKDPFLALGVCDAFRDAELLANALVDVRSGARPEDEALADYERRRNKSTLPDFRQNLAEARLEPPPPEFLGLRAQLRGDAEATRRFYFEREGRLTPPAPA